MIDWLNTPPQKKYNILLIGDSCIDEYHYGTCDRLNPEAPVPVLAFTKYETKPGMAANVKENLLSLGCNVTFVTSEQPSVKKRFIDTKSNYQLLRVDVDSLSSSLSFEDLPKLNFDAIIISDYNKGLISYSLVNLIRNKFNGPIFVDTKKSNLDSFEGCFVKINSMEYDCARSLPKKENELIVTMGKDGVRYNGLIFASHKVDVYDVCGAGDTFLSALTYGYLRTCDIILAIKFANLASSITVQHLGVYAPTIEEIYEARGFC